MKKRLKSIWMILLATVAAAFVFVGCSLGETEEEARKNRNVTTSVTYYANGGTFSSNKKSECVLWYATGSLPLNIGIHSTSSGSIGKTGEITRENYEFAGWYYVELDGEGNPILEDEGKGVYRLTDTKVDFSVAMEADSPWYVGARWKKNTKVNVQLVCDEGVKIPVDQNGLEEGEYGYGVDFKNGDIVMELAYSKASGEDWIVDWDSQYEPFNAANDELQFVEYYVDEACTQAVEWAKLKQGESDVTIYAKYIDSEWIVVKNASGVKEMLSSPKAGSRFWVAKNISASSVTKLTLSTSTFNCEIQGNGFTISDMPISQSSIGNTATALSLFGKIGVKAVIENLTFENLTVTCGVKTGCKPTIYAIFTSLAEGAQISNVRVSGTITLDLGSNASCPNLEQGTNKYYGGYEYDADYVAESEGRGFVTDVTVKQ